MNLLILALDPSSEDEIKSAIEARKDRDDVNVHVVAPAMNIGTVQWLLGAEDDARAEAGELADQTADAVDTEVETEVGDRDPVLAVEDALALFPADEILVAGTADEKTEAALRRIGVPVSRLGGGAVTGEEATGAEAFAHGVSEGRSPETPFVVVGTVGAVLLGVIALIAVIAFLAFWLA